MASTSQLRSVAQALRRRNMSLTSLAPWLRSVYLSPRNPRMSWSWCQRRTFAHSSTLLKKTSKASKDDKVQGGGAGAAVAAQDNPFDFSALEAGIQKAQETLREALSKLRGGGKFNPELVENLRVQVVKGSSNTDRLADLAQVVPRGRTLQIIAGDQGYVKAISSAIQTSKLNLNPQADHQNPAQLNINLPPPTAESRRETVDAAAKAAQVAATSVQNARAISHKRLQAMRKAVRPDDLKKANAQMEKLVTAGTAEVKRIGDAARKTLEAS